MKKLFTKFAPALALLAVLGAAQTAKADEVTVTGTSTGSFSGGNAGSFLTFTGQTFTATTALGTGAFSGADRLGTFTLTTAPLQSLTGNFTMTLTFVAPAGITGGQASMPFTAVVSGSVSTAANVGGAVITFNNPQQTFSFANASGSGSFTITLPNFITVQSGDTAQLEARLTGSQTSAVPEPATMILLGTGLAGVAAKVRKRRKGEAESA